MDYEYPNYDDYEREDDYEPEEEWRDAEIDRARGTLEQFFKSNTSSVFFIKQLQVMFEKEHFHWITASAINELIDEGFLKAEECPLGKGAHIKFVFNHRHRYYKRQIDKSLKVVKEYSDPIIARACGRQAEVLFFNAFMGEGFLCKGQNTNKYRGKIWKRTKHDLDFIIERDGRVYGCEVKNTFGYIEKGEMELKLKLCDCLGVRPLFIMRFAPKDYNWKIIQAGGIALLFKCQIYPVGQEKLVERIIDVLGLPVDCPGAIPEGIIKRFLKLHKKV